MSEGTSHIIGLITAVSFLLILGIAQIFYGGNVFNVLDCLVVFIVLCLYKIFTIRIGYKKPYASRQALSLFIVNVMLFVASLLSIIRVVYFKHAYFAPLILSAEIAMHGGEIVRGYFSRRAESVGEFNAGARHPKQ